MGVQLAHPKSLVIDIAGEASVLMTMQETSTAVQHDLPIKIFVINNQYMGMVRQWNCCIMALRAFLYRGAARSSSGSRMPTTRSASGASGRDLDDAITEMINVNWPVIFDCVVDPAENCFPSRSRPAAPITRCCFATRR